MARGHIYYKTLVFYISLNCSLNYTLGGVNVGMHFDSPGLPSNLPF